MNNNLEQEILKSFNDGRRSEEIACKYNLSISTVTKLKRKLGINNVELVLSKIEIKDFIFFSLLQDLSKFKDKDIKVSIIYSKSLSKTEYKKQKEMCEKRFNIINDFIFLEKEEDLISYLSQI